MIAPIIPGTKPQGWPRVITHVQLDGWRKKQVAEGRLHIDGRYIVGLSAGPGSVASWSPLLNTTLYWQKGERVRIGKGMRVLFRDAAGQAFALSND